MLCFKNIFVNHLCEASQLPLKPVIKPSTKMKQFNWTKIPNNKVISSYWKDVTEAGIELDASEVEQLFAAKEDKRGTLKTSLPDEGPI